MAPACLKTKKKVNQKLVVMVRVPKVSSYTRRQKKKLQKKEVKSGQNQLGLWDFPADLVASIVDGLSSADRIRFGATCKTNLSLVTTTTPHQYQFRPIDKLPWLATFNCHAPGMTNLRLEFSLFQPLHIQGQPDYATFKIKDPKGEGFGDWMSTPLKASNKGWLLCQWPKQAEQGKETGLTSFLLFSPFNKRTMKLPDLDHSFVNNWVDQVHCHAAFSTDPSSPDCVYFFLSQKSIPGKVRISTLDQTTKEWKTTVFDKLIDYVSSVVYNQGCFYCLSSKGQLAAYDVAHQTWQVVVPRSSTLSSLVLSSDTYLAVCQGKVILVVLDKIPAEYKVEMNSCGLFEFSSSTGTWAKKTSLGNHALFVGQTSSFSVPVMPSDNIADRVYFYSTTNNPFYYSLKDGRCHQCKDSGAYWSSDVKGGIWIEPPCLTGCLPVLLEESV